jgi:hypothetical protein
MTTPVIPRCDDEDMTSGGNRSGVVPAVVRTFADGEEIVRFWSRLRRMEYRVPAGLVHAAEHDATSALCGVALTELQEFGRSRHPFEAFPHEHRCDDCDDAAGRPEG